MLMDFSDISAILTREVHDVVDHAFVVYSGDNDAIKALEVMGDNHRTVIVDFIPTAENLAKWAFEQVEPHIVSAYGNKLQLIAMHVWETPKSHGKLVQVIYSTLLRRFFFQFSSSARYCRDVVASIKPPIKRVTSSLVGEDIITILVSEFLMLSFRSWIPRHGRAKPFNRFKKFIS